MGWNKAALTFAINLKNALQLYRINRIADVSLNLDNGMQLLITFEWTLPGITDYQRGKK